MVNQKIKLKLFFNIILFLIITSCNNDRLNVNIDDTNKVELKIKRLDRDLFEINEKNYLQKSTEFVKKYGLFYETFTNEILNPGDVTDSVKKAVLAFVNFPEMKIMHQDVQNIFTDEVMKSKEIELGTAFTYFKFHFPDKKIPDQIITFESGFNYNITTINSTLGIGLEMYLGDKNKFYEMLQWPKYKVSQLKSEYIVPDAMKGWLLNQFDTKTPMNNLLDYMVYYGKFLYCMDAVLPGYADSVKIGYTSAQLNYCNKFEKKIWAYFTEKDRLYKNDIKHVNEYISEGPFTSAISKECPPRIAMWVGWQLVRNFMNKNDDVSLSALMNSTPAQKILNQSKSLLSDKTN
jgi:hypothetical protein